MAEVDLTGQLATAMITLYRGDAKRIQHFMKVYAYARMIALEEQVNRKLLQTIEAAALVHDIGIHAAEKKYGSSVGKFQVPAFAVRLISAIFSASCTAFS